MTGANRSSGDEARLHLVPSLWLPLIGLGIVVALSMASVGIDLLIDQHTALETSELVDNSLHSVAIADDLRNQVNRLARPNLDESTLAAVARHIAQDAKAYSSLANAGGEVEEWSRLQITLYRLQHERNEGNRPQLLGEAERSIDLLIEINQREAENFVRDIRQAHRSGLIADIIVGLITLALALGVASVLVRSMRRQRELVRLRVEELGERNRDLAAFAARTAHDLKGPLAPLRGYADLLAAIDPDARDVASKIARATDRMATIIDDLLALSMSGRPPAGEVAIDDATHEMIEELAPLLGDAHVETSLPHTIAACAPGVFHQILRNIITNAIKFRAPDRQLHLEIEARRLDDTIEIAVADNGLGMPGEAVERAFDPFFRGRTARSIPGHGLGLAIVKRTVEALGGTCKLESELGRGTRVVLRIPAARPSAQLRHSA